MKREDLVKQGVVLKRVGVGTLTTFFPFPNLSLPKERWCIFCFICLVFFVFLRMNLVLLNLINKHVSNFVSNF